ncbi:MAG: tRNA uridine-5-carboxymethylaminomethyl(34) synthesis GTPase MnmE, partial [Acidobacteriota bacterium]
MLQTIVALATPTGRSGIGVIRLSGPDALNYFRQLCGEPAGTFPPRRASLKTIVDPKTGDPIDQAVVTFF